MSPVNFRSSYSFLAPAAPTVRFGNAPITASKLINELSHADLTQASDWGYALDGGALQISNRSFQFRLGNQIYRVSHFQYAPGEHPYSQTPKYVISRSGSEEWPISRRQFEALATQLEPRAKAAVAEKLGLDEDLNLAPTIAKMAKAVLNNQTTETRMEEEGFYPFFSAKVQPKEKACTDLRVDSYYQNGYEVYSFTLSNEATKNEAAKTVYQVCPSSADEVEAVKLLKRAIQLKKHWQQICPNNNQAILKHIYRVAWENTQKEMQEMHAKLDALIA